MEREPPKRGGEGKSIAKRESIMFTCFHRISGVAEVLGQSISVEHIQEHEVVCVPVNHSRIQRAIAAFVIRLMQPNSSSHSDTVRRRRAVIRPALRTVGEGMPAGQTAANNGVRCSSSCRFNR